jgi:hypothetical protein
MVLVGRLTASLMPPISSRPDMNSREAGQRSHRSRIRSRARRLRGLYIKVRTTRAVFASSAARATGGAIASASIAVHFPPCMTAFASDWFPSWHKSPQDTLKSKVEWLRWNPSWSEAQWEKSEARWAKFVSRDRLNSKAVKQKRIRPCWEAGPGNFASQDRQRHLALLAGRQQSFAPMPAERRRFQMRP